MNGNIIGLYLYSSPRDVYCKIIMYSELFKSQDLALNRSRFEFNPKNYNFDQSLLSSSIKCTSYYQAPRVVLRIK